jgi:hypothetical protein
MMSAIRRCISAPGLTREILTKAWLALALLAPAHAEAQSIWEPSLIHRLPEYCKYTQAFRMRRVPGSDNPTEVERWTRVMGPTFVHMHHYCFGLMASDRAAFLSTTRQDRLFSLRVSVTEFDYVLQRAPVGFSLIPEILTSKGESLIRAEKGAEGVGVLRQAIEVKPDYAPPYGALSDYYKEAGALAKAREWVEKGLAAAPTSRALMRRQAELSGSTSRRKTDQGSGKRMAPSPPG